MEQTLIKRKIFFHLIFAVIFLFFAVLEKFSFIDIIFVAIATTDLIDAAKLFKRYLEVQKGSGS